MIDIPQMTIVALQDAMDQRQITARELVLFYLSRIAQIDQGDGDVLCQVPKCEMGARHYQRSRGCC